MPSDLAFLRAARDVFDPLQLKPASKAEIGSVSKKEAGEQTP